MSTNKTRHYKTKMPLKHEKRYCKCVHTHKALHPSLLYAAVRVWDDPSSPQQLRTYLIDGPYLNQKTYKDIRISYSLKYKHLKKNFFRKKINSSLG